MATQEPVLIIGGGLSGLSLAHTLKQKGVPYKLFERDTGKEDRVNQGWSISMHFCLHGLSKAMDPHQFSTLGTKASVNQDQPDYIQFSLVNGITNQQLLTFDTNTIQATDPSKIPPYPTYRINRKRFRAWLLENLDVTWNKRLVSYRILSNDSGVEATFMDGTTVRGSILVGADGVNSMVCQQLMTTKVFHQATIINPVRALVVLRWLTEEEYAPIQSFSKTLMMAFGSLEQENVCCFAALNDIHSDPTVKRKYQVIFSLSRYDESKTIPWYNDNTEKLQQFKTWAKQGFEGDIQKVLLEVPEDTVVTYLTIRERYPHPDSLINQGRIALVGDAAHSMTMFRGEGGNHAILDATNLGQALVDAYNVDKNFTFFDAIQKYNEEMIPRGIKAVKDSHDAAYDTHKSPDTIVKHMQSMMDNAYK